MLLAEYEFDGFRKPTGCFRPLDFSIAARPDLLDEPVAGQWFRVDINIASHG